MSYQATGANAYRQTVRETEDPKKIERRLFASITTMMETHKNAMATRDIDAQSKLRDALAKNRNLWSALLKDAAQDANRLPEATRAQIISIAMFVNRHTVGVLKGEKSIEPLISVNRTILAGLRAQDPNRAPALRGAEEEARADGLRRAAETEAAE